MTRLPHHSGSIVCVRRREIMLGSQRNERIMTNFQRKKKGRIEMKSWKNILMYCDFLFRRREMNMMIFTCEWLEEGGREYVQDQKRKSIMISISTSAWICIFFGNFPLFSLARRAMLYGCVFTIKFSFPLACFSHSIIIVYNFFHVSVRGSFTFCFSREKRKTKKKSWNWKITSAALAV